MFAVTHPIALLGLLAIGLPLAIHLLQKGSGSVVKVGSLNPYRSVEKHRFWKLQPRQKLLLLLRIATLVMLVLIMAGLHWNAASAQGTGPKWVLISPAVAEAFSQTDLPESLQKAKNTMENLLQDGYQKRLLAPGFPETDRYHPLERRLEPLNYWSLAAEAASGGPGSIHVFAEPFVDNYSGQRPHLDLSWTTVPLKITNRWVEDIEHGGQGELRVTLGRSDAKATQFETYLWSPEKTRQDSESFPFEVSDQRLHLKATDGFPRDDSAPVPDPNPLKVGLFFSDTRSEDAQFIKAALKAMSAVDTPLEVTEYREKTEDLPKFQWIFWLSEKPLPQTLIRQIQAGATGLTDAKGQPDWVATQLLWGVDRRHPSPEIRKRINAGRVGQGVWFCSDGTPILTLEHMGRGGLYRFHSRFHPSWTSLVFSEAFPKALHPLLPSHEPRTTTPTDTRWLHQSQIAPVAVEKTAPDSPKYQQQPPPPWLWAPALLCFLLERRLSERNRP